MTPMAVALPAQCSVALKEWATVLEAMVRGEQVVLIRKGGLIEPGNGFTLQAETFVFYPTFEHQTVQYLRPEFSGYFDAAMQHRAPEGFVAVDLVGHAVASTVTPDAGVVERLRPYYIYNDAFLTQRLKWQPDTPLTIVVVRAFRLTEPLRITVKPQYTGCKSWVELDDPLSLNGATPVFEEARFQQQLRAINQLLR